MSHDDVSTRDSEGPPAERTIFTRRQFLTYTGAAGAAVLYVAELPGPVRMALASAGKPNPYDAPKFGAITHTTLFRRRDDMVALRFDLYNLKVDTTDSANPKLVAVDTSKRCWVVVA